MSSSSEIKQRLLNEACAHLADIVVLDRVDSTSAWLLTRQTRAPLTSRPTAVWALDQTAGRGRRDKRWIGDPESSIALSIGFCRPLATTPPLTGLPLAVGVAIVQALSGWVLGLGLKWPNDLQRDGRKCGGILLETRILDSRSEFVVIGVGLNLTADARLQQAVEQPICGLFDAGATPARATIVAELIGQLVECWRQFQCEGLAYCSERWQALDVLRDKFVLVDDAGARPFGGIAQGITPAGALRVATDEGVLEVFAGDVSVRAGKG